MWLIHIEQLLELPSSWEEFDAWLVHVSGQRIIPQKARETLESWKRNNPTMRIIEYLMELQKIYAELFVHSRPDVITTICINENNVKPYLRRDYSISMVGRIGIRIKIKAVKADPSISQILRFC